jgi:hypothetical protein
MCTLYQSCSQFIKEQKSRYDYLMKMARTCSNRAHKSGFHADFRLRKNFQSSPHLQFHEPLFETLYLPIQTELVQAPIDNVVVLLQLYKFDVTTYC